MLQKLTAVAVAVAAYNLVFFLPGFPQIGTVGFLWLVLTTLLVLVTGFPKKFFPPSRLLISTSIMSVVSAVFALYQGYEFNQFLLACTSLGLIGVTIYLLARPKQELSSLGEVLSLPWRLGTRSTGNAILVVLEKGPRGIGQLSRIISRFLDRKKTKISKKEAGANTSKLVRALLITFPVAALITLLLVSADPVFHKLVKDWLTIDLPTFDVNLQTRVIISSVIMFVTATVTTLSLHKPFYSPLNNPKNSKFPFEFTFLTLTVAVILGVFLVIQYKYLFTTVPDTQLNEFGIKTYSEYVRKGFVELILVTLITYTVAGFGYIVSRATQFKATLLQTSTLLLVAETLIFIGSIFRRVYLYQSQHGLTLARMYGMILLGLMVGLLLTLAARQLQHKKSFDWFYLELALVLLTVFVPSFIKPELIIAKHYPPTVNNEVDYTYLARQSSDAVDGWFQAYDWAKQTLNRPGLESQDSYSYDDIRNTNYAQQILSSLHRKYQNYEAIYGSKENFEALTNSERYRSYYGYKEKYIGDTYPGYFTNITDKHAYTRLSDRITVSEINELLKKANELTQKTSASKTESVKLDRSASSPLL